MDAHALLTSQGWRGTGHSLNAEGRGLARPLLVTRKQNTLGLGKKTQAHRTSDQWWMNAFDKSLKGLDTSEAGKVVQTVHNGGLDMVAKAGARWVGTGGLYASFVRGESLSGTIQPVDVPPPTKKRKRTHDDPERRPKESKEERRARKAARRTAKIAAAESKENHDEDAANTTAGSSSDSATRTETKAERRERKRLKKLRRANKTSPAESEETQKKQKKRKPGTDGGSSMDDVATNKTKTAKSKKNSKTSESSGDGEESTKKKRGKTS